MKITRAELKSIINEVLSEVVDSDKYSKILAGLADKRNTLNVNSAKIGVDVAKVKLAQAQSKEEDASDAFDAANARGEDTTAAKDTLDNAKESTKKARLGVSAAKNALSTAQKGGVPSAN